MDSLRTKACGKREAEGKRGEEGKREIYRGTEKERVRGNRDRRQWWSVILIVI